jgi:hypothetical protein
MIDLSINGQNVDISLDLELALEFESNIFDLDADSKIFSFPFKLPATDKNQKALFFPWQIGSQSPATFPAQLGIGTLFLSGEFILTSTTKVYYEGFFKSGLGLLKQYGGRFLGEFLDFTLGSAGMDTFVFYNTVLPPYLPKGGAVCFPETLFPLNVAENGTFRANNWRNNNGGSFLVAGDAADPLLLPCIQLKYALKTFFEAVGYSFEDNAGAFFPQFLDVYFFNNKTPYKGRDTRLRNVPNPNILQYPMRLGDFAPAVTIKDFFAGLRKTFGLWVFIDDVQKKALAYFQKELVLKTADLDWTGKINPLYTKAPEASPPIFSFEFSNGVSDLDWVKLPPINDNDPIPDLLDNEIVFVIENNQYLRREELNPFYPNYRAYIPFSYGQNNYIQEGQTQNIQTPFGAARKVFALLVEGSATVRKTGNKVELVVNFISPIQTGMAYVLDPQSAWEGGKTIQSVLNNRILLNYNFNSSPFVEGQIIQVRFVFPLTDFGPLLDYTQEGDNLLFIYHGLLNRPPGGTPGQRTYGSPDSYGPSNQPLNPLFAIRWDFEDGLYKLFWDDYQAYLSRPFIESAAALNVIDAQKIAQEMGTKIYLQGGGFLIEKLSLKADTSGFNISNITLK